MTEETTQYPDWYTVVDALAEIEGYQGHSDDNFDGDQVMLVCCASEEAAENAINALNQRFAPHTVARHTEENWYRDTNEFVVDVSPTIFDFNPLKRIAELEAEIEALNARINELEDDGYDIRDHFTEDIGGYWHQWTKAEINEVEEHATEAALEAGGYRFLIDDWYNQNNKTGVPLDDDLLDLDEFAGYAVRPQGEKKVWVTVSGNTRFFSHIQDAWNEILGHDTGVPAGVYEIVDFGDFDDVALTITRPEAIPESEV